jgi:glycosyltransferase involved in cell wall biosynthesis
MKKNKLSVVLATRNEELNLEKCLQAVKHIADEIVIVDEKSGDDTLNIARKFKAKVISVEHQDNFHINKNIAIDKATGDWILQLDADEVVSKELAHEIKTIVGTDTEYNGFWVNRRNWFLDRFLTKGGQYPDPTLRLYRKGKGRLPARDVHEQAVVEGKVGHLKNDLLHYRDLSFEKYLEGFNRYSSFIASQLESKRVSFSLGNTCKYLILKPLQIFLTIYIRHRGYVDGKPGFIFSLFSGLIYPVAYIKLWQRTNYPAAK